MKRSFNKIMANVGFWASLVTMVFQVGFAEAGTWVSGAQGKQIYIETVAPRSGQPTVVLLNGLTYSLRQYDRMTAKLTALGIGVVRIDMFAMGQTLLKYAPMRAPVDYRSQVADVYEVLRGLGISRANIVGLSYGGGIGIAFAQAYPRMVQNLIVLAPYTEALASQDNWIKNQILMTRLSFPMNPASDDELYDFFLRQNVYFTYPSAEPIVLENPYKLEAVFRMVQGIRKWKASPGAGLLPDQSVHLMIAGMDQYVPRDVLLKFWSDLPGRTKRSVILVENTEHKMPESVPQFSASWIAEIVRGNQLLAGGRYFQANPFTGSVKHQNGEFKVKGEF